MTRQPAPEKTLGDGSVPGGALPILSGAPVFWRSLVAGGLEAVVVLPLAGDGVPRIVLAICGGGFAYVLTLLAVGGVRLSDLDTFVAPTKNRGRAVTDEEIEAMFTPGPPCAKLLGWRLLAHDEASTHVINAEIDTALTLHIVAIVNCTAGKHAASARTSGRLHVFVPTKNKVRDEGGSTRSRLVY